MVGGASEEVGLAENELTAGTQGTQRLRRDYWMHWLQWIRPLEARLRRMSDESSDALSASVARLPSRPLRFRRENLSGEFAHRATNEVAALMPARTDCSIRAGI